MNDKSNSNNSVHGSQSVITNRNIERINLFERSTRENKTTEFRDAFADDLKRNLLKNQFFSKENIQIIEHGIREGVYKLSNNQIVLEPQNEINLMTIMQKIFLQSNDKQIDHDIPSQISKLNKHVLDYSIPNMLKEAEFHSKYLKDTETLVIPLERAKQVDRDFKQLQYKDLF